MDIPDSIRTAFKKVKKKHIIGVNILIFSLILSAVALDYFTGFGHFSQANLSTTAEIKQPISSFPITVPTIKYGFVVDTFQLAEKVIQPGQNLGDILTNYNIDYPSIEKLVANSKDIFDVRLLRVDKPYTILSQDTTQSADYFIYEPSAYEYIVFELKDDFKVERVKRPITTETVAANGVIESSLWNAMVNAGLSFEITSKMEDALQWQVDFHHIEKGDEFKLIYDQEYIDGEKVGIGQLRLAQYKRDTQSFYSIYFENEDAEISGYYDLDGRPMKSKFLRAPVKYSRISSYYNLNRFHPVLRRVRPHLGTDYAAPRGTPIYAIGDGVVNRVGYTKGNGNFVKIKHDKVYETQYLHMQRFAKGIKVGTFVRQGQVIGYVGSTGLATGPHVCFRFWKNGRQVNHLNLIFPQPKPLPEEVLPAFFETRDEYIKQLNAHLQLAVNEEPATEAPDDLNPDIKAQGNP
ncbi:MAG: peptidoglycan DD-metalloendopeptidase family protein [Bacteroidota bacterium]